MNVINETVTMGEALGIITPTSQQLEPTSKELSEARQQQRCPPISVTSVYVRASSFQRCLAKPIDRWPTAVRLNPATVGTSCPGPKGSSKAPPTLRQPKHKFNT